MNVVKMSETVKSYYPYRGVARILDKGVLEYAREARAQNFKPRPLINRQGQSSNYQRERILNIRPSFVDSLFPVTRPHPF